VVETVVGKSAPLLTFLHRNMLATFEVNNGDPRICIYCRSTVYREADGRRLGDEHVIPESLGGTLVLEQAACQDCERRINTFEQAILKTVLYAPRVHLGIRRKRRKRGEESIKLNARIGGKDVDVVLPIKTVPVLLFLITFGSPGLLIGAPAAFPNVNGAWALNLGGGAPVPKGYESIASPILDTFKFCQFLAKIAHSFAVATLGDTFVPALLDVIREDAAAPRFDLIGCSSPMEAPSNNLHEIGIKWQASAGTDYAIVRIRLFASLGAPTYLVIAGKRASS
jgi:hypothetical protein